MNIRRLKQLIRYGWKHAGVASSQSEKSRIALFFDILSCYYRYGMWSNQYLKNKFHKISEEERSSIGNKLKQKNEERDAWNKDLVKTIDFFIKYGNIKYEAIKYHAKRNKAYQEFYHTGEKLHVGYGVEILRHHYCNGTLSIGEDVGISKNCKIDYSGNLIIEDHVYLSQGVYVLTHDHDATVQLNNDIAGHTKAVSCDLIFHDNSWVGAFAKIMPPCHSIGRGAIVGAGAVVRNSIPPYAIVLGNPAKIVGFKYTPEEIVKYEKEHYPQEERIPKEILESNYNKYFISRFKDIKQYNKL